MACVVRNLCFGISDSARRDRDFLSIKEGIIMKSLILCIAGISLFVATAFAHPPSKIVLVFDKEKSILDCVVYHDVKNPQNHFIEEIAVFVNGKEVLKKEFSGQDNKNTQPFVTALKDISPGDVISVEADCNVFGKRTEKLETK